MAANGTQSTNGKSKEPPLNRADEVKDVSDGVKQIWS